MRFVWPASSWRLSDHLFDNACRNHDRRSSPSIRCIPLTPSLPRHLDTERRPLARLAFDRDPALVVADHRLHDGQPQAGSVRLGGVIGRKQAAALLGREPLGPLRGLGEVEQRVERVAVDPRVDGLADGAGVLESVGGQVSFEDVEDLLGERMLEVPMRQHDARC